jgi:hypothetical protein
MLVILTPNTFIKREVRGQGGQPHDMNVAGFEILTQRTKTSTSLKGFTAQRRSQHATANAQWNTH